MCAADAACGAASCVFLPRSQRAVKIRAHYRPRVLFNACQGNPPALYLPCVNQSECSTDYVTVVRSGAFVSQVETYIDVGLWINV